MCNRDQNAGWLCPRPYPLWALLLLWAVALPLSAQERLALVIGNTAYDGTTFSHLQRGPVLDAEGVGAKLKTLGFTLVNPDGDGKPVINAGMQQMRGALSLFTQRLHQSPGAMAFVFYAGHGIAAKDSADADEKTYLIPVNAPIVFENDAQEYALSLDKVVRDIEGARASVGVVVLDACRNNGLQSPWRNSLTRGVVLPKYASNGVMVAFSTKAGSVAENSPQSMSVFSRALVNRLGTPGQSLFDTFLSVRADVTQQSQQVPQVSLVDLAINPVLVPGKASPVPSPTPPVVITGSLNVTTTPAGASVHIDGAYAGTGPAVISDLAGGSTVTVRVEKSGFEAQERKVRVPAGQTLAVSFSLTKRPDPRPVPAPEPTPEQAPVIAGIPVPKMVQIPGKPYLMGVYEVTFDEYDAFAKATGRQLPGDQGWGRGTRPVINVSFDDAVAYAEWLSGRTGLRFRLPTEEEWEHAAWGGTRTEYWWGDAIGSGNANCDGCGSQWDNQKTAPVHSFRANPFGLYQVHGNVWEWTSSCWDGDCGRRVVRGGGWNFDPVGLRSAYRLWMVAADRLVDLGFRLAQDTP